MTTVLELVQSAFGEMGIPEPASLLTTGQIESQAKRLLYAQSRYLRNQRVFPQLKKRHTFTTTAARQLYPFPSDFWAFIGNTGWDDDSILPLNGPLSDVEWNEITHRQTFAGPPYAFRVFGPDLNSASSGGQIQLYPIPTGTVDLSFDYFINTLFLKADYTVRGQTITANDDISLFDDDIMIAGIKWRYKQSKDRDFSGYLQEHNALRDKAKTRWNGSFKGRIDGPLPRLRYTVPDGNWSF